MHHMVKFPYPTWDNFQLIDMILFEQNDLRDGKCDQTEDNIQLVQTEVGGQDCDK